MGRSKIENVPELMLNTPPMFKHPAETVVKKGMNPHIWDHGMMVLSLRIHGLIGCGLEPRRQLPNSGTQAGSRALLNASAGRYFLGNYIPEMVQDQTIITLFIYNHQSDIYYIQY